MEYCCPASWRQIASDVLCSSKSRKKMNSLDQRVHTKCQELDEFALARRPFLEQHLQLELTRFKAYNNPKTCWPGWAVVGITMTSLLNLIVTLISTIPSQIRKHFWFTISVGSGNSDGLCFSYPIIVILTPLIRAIVGVMRVSEYIHFNCTLKITFHWLWDSTGSTVAQNLVY